MVRSIVLISLIVCPLFAVIQALPQEDPDFVLSWDEGTCLIYRGGRAYLLDNPGQVFTVFDLGRSGAYWAWKEAGNRVVMAFSTELGGTELALLNLHSQRLDPLLQLPHKILKVLPSYRPNRLLLLTDAARPLVLVDIDRNHYMHLDPPDGGPPVFGFLGSGGRTVMSLSSLGVAHYLDLETGQSLLRTVLPDPGSVQWVSPDRTRIALASAKGLVVAQRLDGTEVWRQDWAAPQRWSIGPEGQLWSQSPANEETLLQWRWTEDGRLEPSPRSLIRNVRRLYFLDEDTLVCTSSEGLYIDRGGGFHILGPRHRFAAMPLPFSAPDSRYQFSESAPFRLRSPSGQLVFQSRRALRDYRKDELEWFHLEGGELIAVDPLQDRVVWRGLADRFSPYPGRSVLLWSSRQSRRLLVQYLDRPENEFVPLAVEEVLDIRFVAGEGVVHILGSRRQETQTRYELLRYPDLRRPGQLLWSRESTRPIRMTHDPLGQTLIYPVDRGYLHVQGSTVRPVVLPFDPAEIRPDGYGLWIRGDDGSLALVQSESGTILERRHRLTSGEEVWFKRGDHGLEVTVGQHLVRDLILRGLGPSVHLPRDLRLPLLLPPHLKLHEVPLPREAGDRD